MTKIIDYKVISYWHSPVGLQDEVVELLKQGFVPHLPIQVTMNTLVNPQDQKEFKSTILYTQVMVKYEEIEA